MSDEQESELSDAVHGLGLAAGLYSDSCAAMVGLHSTDWRILDVLCRDGTMTASAVADRMGVSNGAVTGAMDRLERSGGMRRVRDVQDRRKVLLEIVKDGDEQVEDAYARFYGELAAVHELMDEDERAVVLRYLKAATDAVERATGSVRASGRPARR